jgi:hypothetical protein
MECNPIKKAGIKIYEPRNPDCFRFKIYNAKDLDHERALVFINLKEKGCNKHHAMTYNLIKF